jgi:CheY-like chemotaxis protein
MVQGFAAQSGGTVEIESAPGHGTTVCLLLPRSDAVLLPIVTVNHIAPADATPIVSCSILLLEDEDDVLSVARDTLEEAGCRVYSAQNGKDALAILAGDGDASIGLLFADVVLPDGMNGVEVAREAQRLRPSLKVLLTSGYAEEVLSNSGAKISDLLLKPYTPRELLQRVSILVGKRTGGRSHSANTGGDYYLHDHRERAHRS